MDGQTYILSLKNLFEYLGPTPNSRYISEGEFIVNARHIITCDILEKSDTFIKVFALCLKSTERPEERPHEIKITFIILNNDIQVAEAQCTCKAALSECCKHIAAILIYCSRNNILNFPVLSRTDLEYWTKAAMVEKDEAVPILSHKCFLAKVPSGLKPKIEIDSASILSALITALPNSALAKHCIGRRPHLSLDETGNSRIALSEDQ